jgi:hypothetical protein
MMTTTSAERVRAHRATLKSLDVNHGTFLLRLSRRSRRFKRITARPSFSLLPAALCLIGKPRETPLW